MKTTACDKQPQPNNSAFVQLGALLSGQDLTSVFTRLTLKFMEVQFPPDLQAKLDKLAAETGRAQDELVQDAMAGYLEELGQVRGTLDSRYDDIKSGKVKLIDGEEAFDRLRRKNRAPHTDRA